MPQPILPSLPCLFGLGLGLAAMALSPTAGAAVGDPLGASAQVFPGDGNASAASMASLPGGGFVIVARWSGSPSFPAGLYARFHDASGTPTGNPMLVSTDQSAMRPAVAVDAGGRIVVAWVTQHYKGGAIAPFTEIFVVSAQRLAADGLRLGPAIEVARETFAPSVPLPLGSDSSVFYVNAAIASADDGDFAVAWKIETYRGAAFGLGTRNELLFYSETNTYGRQIQVRRYAADGSTRGEPIAITRQSRTSGARSRIGDLNNDPPALAMNGQGGFVVSWQDDGRFSAPVQAQRHDAGGRRLGTRIDVEGCNTAPVIASDPAGNFVIGCIGYGTSPAPAEIRAQRYTAAGTPQGALIKVAEQEPGSELREPALTVAADGRFLIAWSAARYEAPARYGPIRLQAFAGNGSASGPSFEVEPNPLTDEFEPAVAITSLGDLLVSWRGSNFSSQEYFSRAYWQRFSGN